jgi:hypothetical protein
MGEMEVDLGLMNETNNRERYVVDRRHNGGKRV